MTQIWYVHWVKHDNCCRGGVLFLRILQFSFVWWPIAVDVGNRVRWFLLLHRWYHIYLRPHERQGDKHRAFIVPETKVKKLLLLLIFLYNKYVYILLQPSCTLYKYIKTHQSPFTILITNHIALSTTNHIALPTTNHIVLPTTNHNTRKSITTLVWISNRHLTLKMTSNNMMTTKIKLIPELNALIQ